MLSKVLVEKFQVRSSFPHSSVCYLFPEFILTCPFLVSVYHSGLSAPMRTGSSRAFPSRGPPSLRADWSFLLLSAYISHHSSCTLPLPSFFVRIHSYLPSLVSPPHISRFMTFFLPTFTLVSGRTLILPSTVRPKKRPRLSLNPMHITKQKSSKQTSPLQLSLPPRPYRLGFQRPGTTPAFLLPSHRAALRRVRPKSFRRSCPAGLWGCS
jgi:hypothetical protein